MSRAKYLALSFFAWLICTPVMATPSCWPAQIMGSGSVAEFQTNTDGWAVIWRCPDKTSPWALGTWAELAPNWLAQLTSTSPASLSALWNSNIPSDTVTTATWQQWRSTYPTVYPLLISLWTAANTPGTPQSLTVP